MRQKMDNIQIIGIENLDDFEKAIINKLVNEYYPKIQRSIKNIVSIVLHIMAESKGGKRKRFTVKLRVIAPTRIFESSAEEWDLVTALHKSFEEILHEIEHRFKG